MQTTVLVAISRNMLAHSRARLSVDYAAWSMPPGGIQPASKSGVVRHGGSFDIVIGAAILIAMVANIHLARLRGGGPT
jgi:hypothetical protein